MLRCEILLEGESERREEMYKRSGLHQTEMCRENHQPRTQKAWRRVKVRSFLFNAMVECIPR
jgi:hypothetical protein